MSQNSTIEQINRTHKNWSKQATKKPSKRLDWGIN